jgi:signal peptidase I
MVDSNTSAIGGGSDGERPVQEQIEQMERPGPAAASGGFERRYHSSVEGVVTLLDWLLVAFILALVFQAFGVQAFQIPTGSMAETLRGDHYRMRCLRCGYRIDTGSDSLSIDLPECPNCGYQQPTDSIGPLVNGDRIFVLKCIYQFFNPRRWDVVVFKNPINPKDSYIKRLIGLPFEKVQIIDGDIYINGQIARKPLNVQEELWMPVFLQSCQPPLAAQSDSIPASEDKEKQWQPPFINETGSAWMFDADRPSRFVLAEGDNTMHTFHYDSSQPNDFRAIYGYNDSGSFPFMPMCSDLMVRFTVKPRDRSSSVGAVLEKYGVLYAAKVELRGAMVFLKYQNNEWKELRRTLTDGIEPGSFETFEFANVDRRLVLRWANKRLAYDLVADKDLEGITLQAASPQVRVFGTGGLDIRNIGIYRDTYYLDTGMRATQAEPFELNGDEFFVCGDNSPNSLDSRLWALEGFGNRGIRYRQGIVPKDFMMGKAVMVYWSQAFRPRPQMLPLIPNFNTIKVISGSSEQEY